MGDFKKWGDLSNEGDGFEMGGGGGGDPFTDYVYKQRFTGTQICNFVSFLQFSLNLVKSAIKYFSI